jgi:hypothetical protein
LLQARWEDRIFGSVDLPESKCDKQEESDDQWCQDMGRAPGVLERVSRFNILHSLYRSIPCIHPIASRPGR